MPSDKVIEEYIKTNPLHVPSEGTTLSADEITEAIAMIKAMVLGMVAMGVGVAMVDPE